MRTYTFAKDNQIPIHLELDHVFVESISKAGDSLPYWILRNTPISTHYVQEAFRKNLLDVDNHYLLPIVIEEMVKRGVNVDQAFMGVFKENWKRYENHRVVFEKAMKLYSSLLNVPLPFKQFAHLLNEQGQANHQSLVALFRMSQKNETPV